MAFGTFPYSCAQKPAGNWSQERELAGIEPPSTATVPDAVNCNDPGRSQKLNVLPIEPELPLDELDPLDDDALLLLEPPVVEAPLEEPELALLDDELLELELDDELLLDAVEPVLLLALLVAVLPADDPCPTVVPIPLDDDDPAPLEEQAASASAEIENRSQRAIRFLQRPEG